MAGPFDPLPATFFHRSAGDVAPDLLGRYLVREVDELRLVLCLVETEAYLGVPDRAAHAWGGRRTRRNQSLYLPPGHLYVYFIYGMHFCVNLVTGGAHPGEAVLLRAGDPLAGAEEMVARRGLASPPRGGDVAGGPGKLCQALAIDRALDGLAAVHGGPLYLTRGEPVPSEEVIRAPRVGVAYAGDAALWPLRFAVRGHPEVSRPRPWARAVTARDAGAAPRGTGTRR